MKKGSSPSFKFGFVLILTIVFLSIAVTGASAQATVWDKSSANLSPNLVAPGVLVNGGFETGDFTGWTVVNPCGEEVVTAPKLGYPAAPKNGAGSWFVYSGTHPPLSPLIIPAPPQGTYGAVTDQLVPGTHILYQDITVPSAQTALSFVLYYVSHSPSGFFSPNTLNCSYPPDNQQYRVDLIKPGAAIDSVAAGDVLLKIFQTQPGDPDAKSYTPFTVNLTPFAGQTVRLRFAEVDNKGNFNASVDNVTLSIRQVITVPSEVPEADTLLLLAGGIGGLATWLGWQARKVRSHAK